MRRALRHAVSTAPAFLLLLGVVLYGTGEKVHARLLKLGESVWPGYALIIVDPTPPACDPESFGTTAPTTADEGGDETDALLDDLLDDDAAPSDTPAADDADDELLDDLFGEEEDDASASGAARDAAREQCIAKHANHKSQLAKVTDGLQQFRKLEDMVESAVKAGVDFIPLVLVLLLVICAATANAVRDHIGLRTPRSQIDHIVSQGSMLLAHGLLTASAYSFWQIDRASGLDQNPMILHYLWMGGFGLNALINLGYLVRPPAGLKPGGHWGHAVLTIPLFASMAIISGTYFLLVEGHAGGLAIYISKLVANAILYIHVGLYVWIGMMLKQTRLAPLCFDILRPWRFAPEMLAFVVVAAAAIPTAYSGASGIFVIAAGAVIYDELRRAGARRQTALAATAMSGSLGVVLSPCLLVVIVASLNREVTTDQLYGWGVRIFGLTCVLFLAVTLISNRGRGLLKIASPKEALGPSLRRLLPLLPYALIGFAMLGVYDIGLHTHVDEHSAPIVLPAILLVLLLYDRWKTKRDPVEDDPSPIGFWHADLRATSETSAHIGALLLLMGLSVCLGGIIERAEVMSMVPESFGSVWTTMVVLVTALVLIGMVMDPYGAVILVSATIASVAYRNGIHPVHFWMVVLLAFELGYLTPPVALNHLLARQVVEAREGDELEAQEEQAGGFYWRHERILMPILVVGTALVIVAFGPLFFGVGGATG